MINWYENTEQLTKQLVNIKSVTEAEGEEQRIAEFIAGWYRALPYFKEAGLVKLFETQADTVKRSSVLAMVQGTKNGGSNKAVILLGHLDTVDVQDYGDARDLATDPDRLPEALKHMGVSDQVLADLESGDYMFGRGALDMKSGVAAHMQIIKYFSEHPDQLCGSLIAVSECDEEGNSAGIFSALQVLADLKQELGLEYIACINSDYSTTDPGDPQRYIYVGSIGKLLACFAVFGKAAHVGQVFSSFDPNLLTAEITRHMCYSPALCDQRLGETTLPPVSLKQTDSKESYTVQTALSSYSYYNVFMYGIDAGPVLRKCKDAAVNAMDAVIKMMNQNYSVWCAMAGVDGQPLPWKTRVYLWQEYLNELAAANGEGFKTHMDKFAQKMAAEAPEMDLRQYSFAIVQEARKYDLQDTPCVVIFGGSTFYPRVEVSGKNEKEKALMAAANKAAEEMNFEAQRVDGAKLHSIGVKMFYPYISDSSFMYDCSEADDSKVLAANMPAYGFRYIHPEDLINRIDAPVVNIGTFGADGHQFTERVEKLHSFQAVPQMVYTAVSELLK